MIVYSVDKIAGRKGLNILKDERKIEISIQTESDYSYFLLTKEQAIKVANDLLEKSKLIK